MSTINYILKLVQLSLILILLPFFIGTRAAESSTADSAYLSILNNPEHWKDEQNLEVKLSNWKDQYLILTMSYTNCRKICPTMTLKTLRELQQRMTQLGYPGQFVVITYDPESDTPQVLTQFRKTHKIEDKNWHFLSGSLAATKALAQQLGLGQFYAMDDHIIHDFRILIYSPKGELKVLDWKHRDIDTIFAPPATRVHTPQGAS